MRIVKERKKYWKHITSSLDKTKRLRSGKGQVPQESEGQEADADAVQRDTGRRCYAQQDRGGGGRTAVGMGANRTVGGRVRRDRNACKHVRSGLERLAANCEFARCAAAREKGAGERPGE